MRIVRREIVDTNFDGPSNMYSISVTSKGFVLLTHFKDCKPIYCIPFGEGEARMLLAALREIFE